MSKHAARNSLFVVLLLTTGCEPVLYQSVKCDGDLYNNPRLILERGGVKLEGEADGNPKEDSGLSTN